MHRKRPGGWPVLRNRRPLYLECSNWKGKWYEIGGWGVDLGLPGRVWILFQVDRKMLEGVTQECVLRIGRVFKTPSGCSLESRQVWDESGSKET